MRKLITALALIIALFTVTSCAKKTVDEPNVSAGAIHGVITVVLDYLPNTNHTGLYVALKNGYFSEAGFANVNIIQPADNAVTTLIATGNGDFGISYQEDVTYARTASEPLPIRAIATIIRHNTSGFATFADKNITRPRDFEGKTYSGWGSPAEEAVIAAMMRADGGDPDKLNYIVGGGGGYEALRGDIDIQWYFWAWDGIMAERSGIELNYIELRDFDNRLDYYTPVIIASEDTIANQPEKIRAFLAAVARGYEFAIDHPEDAAKILATEIPEYEADMLRESQAYLSTKYIDDGDAWGVMMPEIWDGYTDFMLENGLIDVRIPADECMTNEFLPAS